MPRIDEAFLDCVIYLYPTVEDAETGRASGGTGFLVGYPVEDNPHLFHLYAITNSHVITNGFPVVRLNTASGKSDPLPINKQSWRHHVKGHDIAAARVEEAADQAISFDRFWHIGPDEERVRQAIEQIQLARNSVLREPPVCQCERADRKIATAR